MIWWKKMFIFVVEIIYISCELVIQVHVEIGLGMKLLGAIKNDTSHHPRKERRVSKLVHLANNLINWN